MSPPTSTPTRFARPAWHDAYDAQMALFRWYRTTAGMEWLKGLYHAQANELTLTPKMIRSLAGLFDAEQAGKLIDLDPFYVSAEMCELVEAARDSFEPEPLLMSDLLTPRGFLWYEQPITIHSKQGHALHIRAFSWAQQYQLTDEKYAEEVAARMLDPEKIAEHGPVISIGENEQLVAEGLMEAMGVAVTLYADRDAYVTLITEHRGAGPEDWTRTAGMPLVPIHLCPWWYGMEFPGNEYDLEGNTTGSEGWWRLLQTTLRLMQQRLARRVQHRPDRATRRAAQRLGYPPETEVVVVRLRRESADPDPGP